jgi:hypothetical protein
MKSLLALLVVLVLILGLSPTIPNQKVVAQQSGVVTVYGTDLVDNTGYNYGAQYFVSSSIPAVTCVWPVVLSHQNVTGSVVPEIELQPNEQGVSIGSFISSDHRYDWSVNVTATYRARACADRP